MSESSAEFDPPRASGPTLFARTNMLLPGVYAWVATVAQPVSGKGVGFLPRALAVAALVSLALGPLFTPGRPRLARGFGVWGFVGLSILTWLLIGSKISVEELDPLRAAFGSVGWALFAFGWGSMRHWGSVPEEDPRAVDGPPLVARANLPPLAGWIFGAGVMGGGLILALAWRVHRPTHALLSHALALTLAVWLVNVAADVAVRRGSAKSGPRQRFWFWAVLILGAMGLLWVVLQAFEPS
jgi:hypothetical protein